MLALLYGGFLFVSKCHDVWESDELTQQSHLSQLVQVHVSQPHEAGMFDFGCKMLVQSTKE